MYMIMWLPINVMWLFVYGHVTYLPTLGSCRQLQTGETGLCWHCLPQDAPEEKQREGWTCSIFSQGLAHCFSLPSRNTKLTRSESSCFMILESSIFKQLWRQVDWWCTGCHDNCTYLQVCGYSSRTLKVCDSFFHLLERGIAGSVQ